MELNDYFEKHFGSDILVQMTHPNMPDFIADITPLFKSGKIVYIREDDEVCGICDDKFTLIGKKDNFSGDVDKWFEMQKTGNYTLSGHASEPEPSQPPSD